MFNKVTFWRVWDPLTKERFRTSIYEYGKYGETTAIAKAKKKLEEEKSPTTEELSAKAKAKASS